ncbi:MAG: DUF4398 domain-containing protein [Xanthomonadaceae bacterium]|nr:DUF4398 domain-containing protein [Xanthomonadaceae bacterium]
MPVHNTLRHSWRNVTVPIFSPPAGPFCRICTAIAIVVLLMLGGCASVPPPNDAMNLAQTQLQAARDAGAADYAPVDLGFAQDKFQQAQAAMAERKYAAAADLAEESRADSALARAKARLGAARAQIQSKVRENTRLRELGQQEAPDATQQNPADVPAGNASAAAPPAALPAQDMPAPAASALAAPPATGFQTVPDAGQQPGAAPSPAPASSGGQP